MVFEVNNCQTIHVFQPENDGAVFVRTIDSNGKEQGFTTIQPGDFVMMLNWYRHQKATGNKDLNF